MYNAWWYTKAPNIVQLRTQSQSKSISDVNTQMASPRYPHKKQDAVTTYLIKILEK